LDRRLDALQATDIASPDEDPSENLRDDIGEEQDSQEKLNELLSTRLAGVSQ